MAKAAAFMAVTVDIFRNVVVGVYDVMIKAS